MACKASQAGLSPGLPSPPHCPLPVLCHPNMVPGALATPLFILSSCLEGEIASTPGLPSLTVDLSGAVAGTSQHLPPAALARLSQRCHNRWPPASYVQAPPPQAKSKVSAGLCFLREAGGGAHILAFSTSWGHHIPWLMTPPSFFKARGAASLQPFLPQSCLPLITDQNISSFVDPRLPTRAHQQPRKTSPFQGP